MVRRPVNVSFTGLLSYPYDGQLHGATAVALGPGDVPLDGVTITYNGSPGLPVNAGAYTVVASFPGDAIHLPASASTTLTISQVPLTVTASDATRSHL